MFLPQGQFHMYIIYVGVISVDFGVTDNLLITYMAFIIYWKNMGV